MQAYVQIDWNMGSGLFEHGLSLSSNHHFFPITLDTHPLNCPLHLSLFGIFCINTYRVFLV
jgi:hypothetical protein